MSSDGWFEQFLDNALGGVDSAHEALSQLDPETLRLCFDSLDPHSLAEALQAAGIDLSHLTDEDVYAIMSAAMAQSSLESVDVAATPETSLRELRFGSSQGGLNHEPQPAEDLSLSPEEAPRAAELLEKSGLHPTKTVATASGITTVPAGQYYNSQKSR